PKQPPPKIIQQVNPPPTPPPPTPPPPVTEVSANAVQAPPPAPPAPPAPPPDIAAGSDLSYGTRPSPPYPPMAARQRHEGTVTLLILVGLDGSPKSVEVEKSSGYRELDRAAKDWVMRHWKFNPEVKAGKKVEGYARVPINFNLSG
ncbi:MAG: energy transducer TonB, partial [Rhodanobacter sp.]